MISLCTTIYEKDFDIVLNKKSWFYNFNHDLIDQKNIFINNIQSIDKFIKLKEEYKNDFVFFPSLNYIDSINDKLNIKISSGDKSFFYSIQHFTQLITSTNKFTFYVGPDCNISNNILDDYFLNSIDILQNEYDVLSTTIPWHPDFYDLKVGEHEQQGINKYNNKFYYSKVFSDQVYFIDNRKLQNINFNILENLHDIPIYAINSFEFRITNFLIKHNYFRAIYKTNNYYTHKSF